MVFYEKENDDAYARRVLCEADGVGESFGHYCALQCKAIRIQLCALLGEN